MPRWGASVVLVAAAIAAAAGTASLGTGPRETAFAGDASGGAGPAKRKGRPKPRPLVLGRLTPRHAAKFVDLAADITMRFSAPVDPASITSRNVIVRRLLEPARLDWTFRMTNGGKTVRIAPRLPFEPGADYEVVVSRRVTSRAGARLHRPKRAIFFTDPRFSPYPVLHPDMFSDLDATMHEPRAAHSATSVGGGYVLLAGGQVDSVSMCISAELFEPATKSFRLLPTLLAQPRAYHQEARLPQGSAILIGGFDGRGNALASTEIYDDAFEALVAGAPMAEARDFHAAVALRDGRVLVSGGLRYLATGAAAYSDTAEILGIDRTWRLTAGRPQRRRVGHTLTLLRDGTVLVVGGTTELSGTAASAEIFDPVTETFRYVAGFPRRHRQLHSAVAIDVGDPAVQHVLLADGGDPIAEVYDGAGEQFRLAGGSSFSNRTRATASLLPSGDVLFAGGFEQRGTQTVILSSIDLYVRGAGDWGRIFYANVVFSKPRAGHTATSLADGRVLFTGGFDQNGGLNLESAVLFTPPPAPEVTPVTGK